MNRKEYDLVKHLQEQVLYLSNLSELDEMRAGEDDLVDELLVVKSLLERVYRKDLKDLLFEFEDSLGR